MRCAVLLAGVLMAGCAIEPESTADGAAAATPSDPASEERLLLGPLNEADPAQAAVGSWHRALVEGDFEAYLAVSVEPTSGRDRDMSRVVFEAMRKDVPSAILINDGSGKFDALVPAEDRIHLAGLRIFSIVGCVARPGDAEATRRSASVSAREVDGQWKVSGGSFGPANHWVDGRCPLDPS